MKRFLATLLLVLASAPVWAGQQFRGPSLAVLNQSSSPVPSAGGGGGGGGDGVVIASDTFNRGPSSGTFLIGSTTTWDNSLRWRALYGTAINTFLVRGATWNGTSFIGGTVTWNSAGSEDQTVFVGTTAPPVSGFKVGALLVIPTSASVVIGPAFQFDSTNQNGVFYRHNEGSLEFYRVNSGAETLIGGVSLNLTTSTGTWVITTVTVNGGNVTYDVDTYGDGTIDTTIVDSDAQRITSMGVTGFRNYYCDVGTDRGVTELWVKNPS